MNRVNNESGQALLMVMMVTIVLLLIGSTALTRTSSTRIRSFEQKRMVQAYYIAEAGIEKALANIKNDPFWLKGLAYDTPVNFITSLDYAGGQITSVSVKRTSAGDNPTLFYIESRGDFQGATRTIKVEGEMYDPIDFAKGFWVQGISSFANNTVYNTDITGQGDLVFSNNVYANGNIMAGGSVTLLNNMTSTSIVAGQDVLISNNVEVTTQVHAGRDILIYNNGEIKGNANAVRNIDLSNNTEITGDVYYNGTLYMGSGAVTGPTHPGGAAPVAVHLPPFPVINESLYSQDPDRFLSDTLSGSFNIEGISYAPGDLSISGTYSGQGMIVVHGKVTISGDLYRSDQQSSLAICALGSDDGVGISVGNNYSVYALLYSPNNINISNNFEFYGSIVCDSVNVGNNTVVTYEPFLTENQPKWFTDVVNIKSWKESNPVF